MPTPPLARITLASLACTVALALAQPAEATPTRNERALLSAINGARAAHGLSSVRFRFRLQSDADGWAAYLRHHDTFFHAWLTSGTRENLGWLTCRDGWARRLVRMWLASPGHRANLLDRRVGRAGVGISTGGWQGFSCVRMTVLRLR